MKKKNIRFWRKEKLKKINAIGSKVVLPFDEEGIVVDYVMDWFPFKIKITKANFNYEGER